MTNSVESSAQIRTVEIQHLITQPTTIGIDDDDEDDDDNVMN